MKGLELCALARDFSKQSKRTIKRSRFFDHDVATLFGAVTELGIKYDTSIPIDHLNLAKMLTKHVHTNCPEECYKMP